MQLWLQMMWIIQVEENLRFVLSTAPHIFGTNRRRDNGIISCISLHDFQASVWKSTVLLGCQGHTRFIHLAMLPLVFALLGDAFQSHVSLAASKRPKQMQWIKFKSWRINWFNCKMYAFFYYIQLLSMVEQARPLKQRETKKKKTVKQAKNCSLESRRSSHSNGFGARPTVLSRVNAW